MNNRKKLAPVLALAMSGSVVAPAVATAAIAGGAVAYTQIAHAASVQATDVKVTTDAQDGSNIVSQRDRFHVIDSWAVPAGTKAGDTTKITLGERLLASSMDKLEVKDPNGNVIGTITGANNDFTVTYTDYAATHQNVTASVSFVVTTQPKAGDSQGVKVPITSTVDGISQTPATITTTWAAGGDGHNYPGSSWAGENGFQEIPAAVPPKMVGKIGFARISDSNDVGKTLSGSIKIGDAPDAPNVDGGNQVFDCDNAMSKTIQYFADNASSDYYPTDIAVSYRRDPSSKYSNQWGTGDNAATNPFQVKITGCTADTLSFTWVPKNVGDVLTMTTRTVETDGTGWIDPYSIVKLDPQAVAHRYGGMYFADATNGASKDNTASTFGYYS